MKTKVLSLLLVIVIIITSSFPLASYANDEQTTTEVTDATDVTEPSSTRPTTSETSTTKKDNKDDKDKKEKEEAKKTLKQQQKELEENLKLAEKKLAELEKNSKVTEEYIDTLDQKIGLINEKLTILQAQNDKISREINKLKPSIKKNEKALKELSDEVDAAKAELQALETKFESVYEAYCYRLRVMYISGDYNIITALLCCKDISSFLTRFEMIKSVSKSDTQLLKEVNAKMDEIVTKQNGLDEKLQKYQDKKAELDKQKAALVKKQNTIEKNAHIIAQDKVVLATDRAESDSLLAELTSQNQQYTEFRNEDEELIKAVENEIQALIAGVKTPEEVTTAVHSDKKDTETTKSSKNDVYANSNAVLNMTYPVPGYYSLSAGFPNYSSGKYHGGIDFPCPVGSNVVAAQNGIVITVKRLDYSYGYYVMIYHGTDAQGRSVVTLYAHNSSLLVSEGQTVKKGETIAKSGSTGNSTGPHCHFEVRFNGERVNPINYLSR